MKLTACNFFADFKSTLNKIKVYGINVNFLKTALIS